MDAVVHRTVVRTVEGFWAPVRESLGRDRRPPFPWIAGAVALTVVATAIVTGAFGHEIPRHLGVWGGAGWPTLHAGRWWTLGSSFLLTRDWFMAATMPLCLFVAVAWYERRAGHLRAFVVFAAGHVTGTVIVSVAFAPLALTHIPVLVRAATNVDYGGSMAIAASLGALVGVVRDRRLTMVALALLLVGSAAHHQMSDWGHVVAMPMGYWLGQIRGVRAFERACAVLVAVTVGVLLLVAIF